MIKGNKEIIKNNGITNSPRLMSEPILITKPTKKGPSMEQTFPNIDRHKKPTIDSSDLKASSLTTLLLVKLLNWPNKKTNHQG